MKVTCTFLLVLAAVFTSLAQKEGYVWYFGGNAGLNFATSPPTVLTNGAVNTAEGSASISNSAGNILFYSDGVTVYNQNHTVMANGNGLLGNFSTTQSAIIVKQPGSSSKYYIFTQQMTGGPL